MTTEPPVLTVAEAVYSVCLQILKPSIEWSQYARDILDQFNMGVPEYEIPMAHTKTGDAYVIKLKELIQ